MKWGTNLSVPASVRRLTRDGVSTSGIPKAEAAAAAVPDAAEVLRKSLLVNLFISISG
jgi:hypothetical protein